MTDNRDPASELEMVENGAVVASTSDGDDAIENENPVDVIPMTSCCSRLCNNLWLRRFKICKFIGAALALASENLKGSLHEWFGLDEHKEKVVWICVGLAIFFFSWLGEEAQPAPGPNEQGG